MSQVLACNLDKYEFIQLQKQLYKIDTIIILQVKKLKTKATELRNKNILNLNPDSLLSNPVPVTTVLGLPPCMEMSPWTFNIGHITKLNDRGKITGSISAVYITKPPVLKNQHLTYCTPQKKSNVKTYLVFPFLEQTIIMCLSWYISCSATHSCPIFCNLMDYSLPGSSVHGIFQARIMGWVSSSYCRGSSQPGNQPWVSCISFTGRQILYHWATWEVHLDTYIGDIFTDLLQAEVSLWWVRCGFALGVSTAKADHHFPLGTQ